MSDISARVHELRALETLASGKTAIHRLHPFAKMLSAAAVIVAVVSFGRCDIAGVAIFLFYPFMIMALAELPYRLMLPRVLIALPFCLFAGIFNIFLDRNAAFTIGGVSVSYGVLSLAVILLKAYICVTAALMLIATTPFAELTAQLRRLRAPIVFIMVFEVTYRYIGVLFEEAYSMTTAYKLRSGNKKAIEIKHMGAFAGHLLLRAFDRAERVHAAMRCRGYPLRHIPPAQRRFGISDAAAIAAVCLPAALMRFFALTRFYAFLRF